MEVTRRTFLAASGLAGLAALNACCCCCCPCGDRIANAGNLPGEDGSKLWLRYVRLPRDVAANVDPLVRAVVVEGNSPTARTSSTKMPRFFIERSCSMRR